MTATPPAHEIRPLSAEDASAWRGLRLEMLADAPGAFTADRGEALARSSEDWARNIPADGVDVLFGLFVHGELCGSAGFYRQRTPKLAHKGMMWGVYVAPDARGRGFGGALVRRVIEHARAHVDTLQTGASAAGAPIYRAAGFQTYGVEEDAIRVDGISYDEELLAMRFGP